MQTTLNIIHLRSFYLFCDVMMTKQLLRALLGMTWPSVPQGFSQLWKPAVPHSCVVPGRQESMKVFAKWQPCNVWLMVPEQCLIFNIPTHIRGQLQPSVDFENKQAVESAVSDSQTPCAKLFSKAWNQMGGGISWAAVFTLREGLLAPGSLCLVTLTELTGSSHSAHTTCQALPLSNRAATGGHPLEQRVGFVYGNHKIAQVAKRESSSPWMVCICSALWENPHGLWLMLCASEELCTPHLTQSYSRNY